MNTNENKKEAKKTSNSKMWEGAKSISLVIAALTLFCFVTGWQPFGGAEIDAYAQENEFSYSAEYEEDAYGDGGVSTPYTSIYDVIINDRQLLMVLDYINPRIVNKVMDELPTATPNEILLRCAYYNSADTEDALNTMLGVTLAADWRTEAVYIPDNAASDVKNQSPYTTNGEGYNAYGDVSE